MLNIDALVAMADRDGFDITLESCMDSPHEPGMARLARGKDLERGFSVCVAAPAYDPSDRLRPFNFKSDDARDSIERNCARLRAASERLSTDGLMFVYGLPSHLPRYAAALADTLVFRYWIAVRALTGQKRDALRPEHTGLLLMSKPGAALNRIRIPHARCRCCGETLKDWGGKSHLMHPQGAALSDVWMDLVVDERDRLPAELFERILKLSADGNRSSLLLLDCGESGSGSRFQVAHGAERSSGISSFDPLKWKRAKAAATSRSVPAELLNRMHKGACLDLLRAIPSETVDLAFADPPFNLTKDYNGYSDDRAESDYLGWCKRWLVEYERVLKPGGALLLLNLPKWSARLADFLSRSGGLFLQNWIVWNALPEPKGVIMPAHYALLYLTKGARAARFNYCSMENGWEPFDEAVFPPDRADVCRRRQCVRRRRASSALWRGELTDIWHDIHRVRKATGSDPVAKAHPCETPERLIDRIIRLATNPGDLVLDAFAGVGTTALVARRLGRQFIAIEQDGEYLEAAERRIVERRLRLERREPAQRERRVSKRALQLELRRLAMMLGRLPTRLDVERFSRFELQAFLSAFASWSGALKAAKIAMEDATGMPAAGRISAREQLELFRQPRMHNGPLAARAACSDAREQEPTGEAANEAANEKAAAGDRITGETYQIS